LFRSIQHSLFPDHVYGFESGGNPDDIPNLSYEEFIDFHKRYYHPSNSRIFVYGDGSVEDRLKFIHEEYLEEFAESEIDSDIPLVKPWDKPDEIEKYYPISADEDEKEKTYLSMNFVTGESNNLELSMAIEILEYILMDSPAAPLKKALLESRLGKDVFGSYNNHLRQPFFSVIVKNSEREEKTKFRELVSRTLENIVKNGIDKN
jgi:Zn-dependent M16 (insulinase) family peptidase